PFGTLASQVGAISPEDQRRADEAASAQRASDTWLERFGTDVVPAALGQVPAMGAGGQGGGLGLTAASGIQGAAGRPDAPVRGAGEGAVQGALLGPLGRLVPGQGALAGMARSALAFPTSGAISRAAFGEGTTGEQALTDAVLGIGFGAAHALA